MTSPNTSVTQPGFRPTSIVGHTRVREVHCNTLEGLWTGVRNFLRPFRGVSKWFLDQYVAIFQWGYEIKSVTDEFLRVLLGMMPSTSPAS